MRKGSSNSAAPNAWRNNYLQPDRLPLRNPRRCICAPKLLSSSYPLCRNLFVLMAIVLPLDWPRLSPRVPSLSLLLDFCSPPDGVSLSSRIPAVRIFDLLPPLCTVLQLLAQELFLTHIGLVPCQPRERERACSCTRASPTIPKSSCSLCPLAPPSDRA